MIIGARRPPPPAGAALVAPYWGMRVEMRLARHALDPGQQQKQAAIVDHRRSFQQNAEYRCGQAAAHAGGAIGRGCPRLLCVQ